MQEKSRLSLRDPVSLLNGVGVTTTKVFNKLKIFSIEDLLRHLPKRFIDARNVTTISRAKNMIGESVVLKARVICLRTKKSFRKKISITHALLSDPTGQIECVWFNRPYMCEDKFGETVFLYGKITKNNFTSRVMIDNPIELKANGIYPIYKKSEFLSDVKLRKYIRQSLDINIPTDDLDNLAEQNNLPKLSDAFSIIHFPNDFLQYRKAKLRFDYEGLTKYIVAGKIVSEMLGDNKAVKLLGERQVDLFINSLPYKLTPDQIGAINDINKDFKKDKPSNRIIVGDVGVGKTVVAASACINAIASKKRVVWIAPTEILANQHFEYMKNNAKSYIKKITLLTSSSKKSADLDSDLIIATHAAIYSNHKITNLGLVIVDEQHRFGVKQREELLKNRQKYPHFLSMTATPIPRTIAHLIFGTLDISFIKTKPNSRKEIKTYFVNKKKLEDSYNFVASKLEKGQQAFVICPLIEEMESGDLLSVREEYKKLSNSPLGKFRIKMLHGKMKSKEKNKILNDFANKRFDILISTTVIEVGIDIADATVVMIENAERFGLAQLHQIRGRVGRREIESFCLLYSNNLNQNTSERLKKFCQTTNGFSLAEQDLKARGPGSLLGFEQSGFADFDFNWLEDEHLVEISYKTANYIMENKNKFKIFIQKAKDLLLSEHLE